MVSISTTRIFKIIIVIVSFLTFVQPLSFFSSTRDTMDALMTRAGPRAYVLGSARTNSSEAGSASGGTQGSDCASSSASSLVFTLPISCQICLSKVKDPVICSNRHVFCKGCMDTWLQRMKQCPACRIDITEGEYTEVLRNDKANM